MLRKAWLDNSTNQKSARPWLCDESPSPRWQGWCQCRNCTLTCRSSNKLWDGEGEWLNSFLLEKGRGLERSEDMLFFVINPFPLLISRPYSAQHKISSFCGTNWHLGDIIHFKDFKGKSENVMFLVRFHCFIFEHSDQQVFLKYYRAEWPDIYLFMSSEAAKFECKCTLNGQE